MAPNNGRIGVISGQTGRRVDGSISEDVDEQTRDALSNIGAALLDLGGAIKDILVLRWLVVDRSNTSAVCTARDATLVSQLAGDPPPSSTIAIVDGLVDHRAFVEVEAWFVYKDET